MEREQLEHIIRAASAISDQYEIVIVGSQSILGAIPNPPASLTRSMEADVYPLANPGLADVIDGGMGEDSPFFERFGYYAQGVGPETVKLPPGWESRLVKVQNANTDLKVGLCLDPIDLAASKLAAGREKDWAFVQEMLAHKLIPGDELRRRVAQLPLGPERLRKLDLWVAARDLDRAGPAPSKPTSVEPPDQPVVKQLRP